MSVAPEAAWRAARLWFDCDQLRPLGEGHIHATFEVHAGASHAVLQCLNEAVFPDPDLVMTQTARVLQHWSAQQHYQVPRLIPSVAGNAAERVGGHLWRVWSFVEGSRVVDPLQTSLQARAAGAAFGAFQAQMAGLPGPRLADTIGGFLQLDHYLRQFDAVAHRAPAPECAVIDRGRQLAHQLSARNSYIHGDCKINNLLFDQAGENVAAVIDFDTVMYGHWAWDFGDLIRSVCFSRGEVDSELFHAALSGFAAAQPLADVAHSVAAPAYVALMLGVRFLTDHLQGDVYFAVQHEGENLQRAQQQLALFEAFQSARTELTDAASSALHRRG